jgi:hypothetical protein
MTLREQHQQSAALNFRIRAARERMTRATAAMDYKTALACQVEIDDLEREAFAPDLRKAELRPLRSPSFWRS